MNETLAVVERGPDLPPYRAKKPPAAERWSSGDYPWDDYVTVLRTHDVDQALRVAQKALAKGESLDSPVLTWAKLTVRDGGPYLHHERQPFPGSVPAVQFELVEA